MHNLQYDTYWYRYIYYNHIMFSIPMYPNKFTIILSYQQIHFLMFDGDKWSISYINDSPCGLARCYFWHGILVKKHNICTVPMFKSYSLKCVCKMSDKCLVGGSTDYKSCCIQDLHFWCFSGGVLVKKEKKKRTLTMFFQNHQGNLKKERTSS